MAKATTVYFEGIGEYDHTSRKFRVTSTDVVDTILVNSFKNGTVVVSTPSGVEINDFLEVLAGCFDKASNFSTEVAKSYNYSKKTIVDSIVFTFNGVTLAVTADNANVDTLRDNWISQMKSNAKNYQKERRTWFNCVQKQKEENKLQEKIEEELFNIDEAVNLEFKDSKSEQKWDDFVSKNSNDAYGKGIVKFAVIWAKYMQNLIKQGKSITEIAEETSRYCNTDEITDTMRTYAVEALSRCWKYGDELLKWYNEKYGLEEATIVNSSLLTTNVG